MADRPVLELEPTYRNSSGRASGIRWLDGAFYGPLVAVVAVCIFGGLAAMTFLPGKIPISAIIVTCSIPILAVMLYVLVFRRNKPPGFDRDLWVTIQFGRDQYPRRRRLLHPSKLR